VKAGPRGILALAASAGLVGTALGVVEAVRDAIREPWVREFQAGAESPLAERISAVAQRTALEGAGFALLGLLLGAFAFGGARLVERRSPTPSREARASRVAAFALVGIAGFVAWATYGAWLAGEALAFLTAGRLLLLNALGIGLGLVGFGVPAWIVGRLPGAPRSSPAACALGAVLSTAGAAWLVLWIAKVLPGLTGHGGKHPTSLAVYALTMAASVPVGLLLARGLARPIIALGAAVGADLPRRARALRLVAPALAIVWGAAALWTALHFELSSAPASTDYPRLPGRDAGPEAPNVVFITIDTLRADHLGCYGYERPTSPFLDSLAAEGTMFEDPVAPAAWTKPSTGTILTGLYPSRHGALHHGSLLQLPEGQRTMAEAFQASGRVTAGFVTNPNIKRVFAFDRGFDEYFDSPVEDTVTLAAIRSTRFGHVVMSLFRHQFNWNYQNDVRQTNRHVFSWLDANRDNRFFLYVHYIDPHIPYDPPSIYRELFARDTGLLLFNDRKREVGIDRYDGEIRYADAGIRELVEHMKRLGIWENTLFVLTSDHGEEFFEHGVMGHGFSLFQEVVRVPLIVHGPGVAAGRRVAEPVQIVDLPATVLDLAGTGVDALGDGRSVAAAVRAGEPRPVAPLFLENEFGTEEWDHWSFVLSGVRQGPYKLVLTEANAYFPPEEGGGQALYDLASDPGELENLIADEGRRPLVEELLAKLRTHARFLAETGFRDAAPAALSPEVEAGLRALGYGGGGE